MTVLGLSVWYKTKFGLIMMWQSGVVEGFTIIWGMSFGKFEWLPTFVAFPEN